MITLVTVAVIALALFKWPTELSMLPTGRVVDSSSAIFAGSGLVEPQRFKQETLTPAIMPAAGQRICFESIATAISVGPDRVDYRALCMARSCRKWGLGVSPPFT